MFKEFYSKLSVVIQRLSTLWSLLVGNWGLLAHGGDDSDEKVLALVEFGLELVTELVLWELDVVLGVTIVGHQGEETVVDVDELVFRTGHVRHVHVVGGWGEVLVLLLGEDVGGHQVDLGVTVLTRLGGGHVHNLAGTALDHDVAVLSKGRALHWVGLRGTGVGGLEMMLNNIVSAVLRAVRRIACVLTSSSDMVALEVVVV